MVVAPPAEHACASHAARVLRHELRPVRQRCHPPETCTAEPSRPVRTACSPDLDAAHARHRGQQDERGESMMTRREDMQPHGLMMGATRRVTQAHPGPVPRRASIEPKRCWQAARAHSIMSDCANAERGADARRLSIRDHRLELERPGPHARLPALLEASPHPPPRTILWSKCILGWHRGSGATPLPTRASPSSGTGESRLRCQQRRHPPGAG